MRALATAALALSIVVAGPLPATPTASAVKQVQADYRTVLMEEVCARHVAGDKDEGLRGQLRRLQALLRRAERHGLGPALQKAKREWDHFQTVADWVCGKGAGVAALRAGIDHFARSIEVTIRARGRR
jgi:hypothetical protein